MNKHQIILEVTWAY